MRLYRHDMASDFERVVRGALLAFLFYCTFIGGIATLSILLNLVTKSHGPLNHKGSLVNFGFVS